MTFLKNIFWVAVFILISFVSVAQRKNSFNIGWNVSHFFKPLSNLEIGLYDFNQKNPNMREKYDMPEFFNGLSLSFKTGSEKGGLLVAFNNNHGVARAEGIATGYGETDYTIRKIKTRVNSYSIGPYFTILKVFNLGITYDIATFRIMKKIGPIADYNNAKWVLYYDQKRNWATGFTLSLNYKLTLKKGIKIAFQPYAQVLWLISYPTFKDNYNKTYKCYYNISNYGLTTYLSLNWEK